MRPRRTLFRDGQNVQSIQAGHHEIENQHVRLKAFHGSNRFGLASLTNLDQLPPTGAVVIAPPLKIVNGSGSPLRVLALVPA